MQAASRSVLNMVQLIYTRSRSADLGVQRQRCRISAIDRPAPEDELDRLLRLLDRQQLDARIREREQRGAAAREHERRQREAEQRAEQVRQEQVARAAAQAEARQRMEKQSRERQAQADRDRLARLEAELAARRVLQLTPEERKRQEMIAAFQEMAAGLDAYIHPKRDPLAEIDALNADLAAREAAVEERLAEEHEARRSAKYKADQAAAIAKRESGR
jgi:hypothetical protein